MCVRSTLGKNDRIAYQCLLSLERKLSQNPELAEFFCSQIEEMLKRGAAVVFTVEELEAWTGDYYYLPMVAAKNEDTFRLCFDASRRQGGYPSPNDCMSRGLIVSSTTFCLLNCAFGTSVSGVCLILPSSTIR